MDLKNSSFNKKVHTQPRTILSDNTNLQSLNLLDFKPPKTRVNSITALVNLVEKAAKVSTVISFRGFFIFLSLIFLVSIISTLPLVSATTEQYFKININNSIQSTENNIILTKLSPGDSDEVTNPINFNFNINYVNNSQLICKLTIGTQIFNNINPSLQTNHNINLQDDNYEYEYFCYDVLNPLINKSISNTIIINESFNFNEISPQISLLNYPESIKVSISSNNANNVKLVLIKPSNNELTLSESLPLPLTNYPIPNNNIDETGIYKVKGIFNNLNQPVEIIKSFTIAKTSIVKGASSINQGETVNVAMNLDGYDKKITSVLLNFGDGYTNVDNYFLTNTYNFTKNFQHPYTSIGTFTLNLTTIIGEKVFSILENGVSVTSSNYIDTTNPQITLLGPKDKAIINASSADFKYQASDNIKLKNCTFELYYYNGSGYVGTLEYTQNINNPENNKDYEISLKEFDKGDYSWIVECYDNSSNSAYRSRDFTINNYSTKKENNEILLSSGKEDYDQKQEVEDLMDSLEKFLKKIDVIGPDEKEALADLNLIEDLNYYNRRLIQIDQDLGSNIRFISDEKQKIQREVELLEEFEELKTKIPTDVKLIEKKEYAKNSITGDIKSVISDYLKYKNILVKDKDIKKLADLNLELQSMISTSTKVTQLEISYLETKKQYTVVSKKITLRNNSIDTLIEVIPKSVTDNADNIRFINTVNVVKKDPLFETTVDDLIDEKLVYYFESYIDPKEIENTDTLLYKDFALSGTDITGFFLIDSDINYFYLILFVIAFIVIFYLSTLVYQKARMYNWKKEENVIRTIEYLKEAKKDLKKRDYANAKSNYHKIKEIFPLLPETYKKQAYKDLKKIQTSIDKKDIFDLVKEYETAKKENRADDSKILYTKIKSTYKRLPEKYQEIIFKKLF